MSASLPFLLSCLRRFGEELTLVVAVVPDTRLPHETRKEEEHSPARRQWNGFTSRPADVAPPLCERREQHAAQQFADEDAEEERSDVEAQVSEAEESVPPLKAGGEDEVVGEGGLHVVR
ncbi:hypothetical protein A1Q1_02444 [Trichosporon asahii var. asahii CBS 2479]|uniref:Uncharacterized protein n=1 Tax=Trichosporon asahii var. asahii (strain ATCC 90039 / CBS 2479 / JCM 2466 / KCTC 7840 / NBRC 103889/ NCYC 2677 / UAMH 7654) TaxID=1186058 RepID=J5T0R2_TRIAS|nr:hypothetical protein A1Q1_02444 [Trichosporon asahii var. asahii CBS 2479]EJT48536.1 hypothetical protein A1Q1_02444 [Trichosporon asahii var. asahii CBS 2479]